MSDSQEVIYEEFRVRHLLSRADIYKPYGFSCSCQASDGYILLPHLCLCQTDIWKALTGTTAGQGRQSRQGGQGRQVGRVGRAGTASGAGRAGRADRADRAGQASSLEVRLAHFYFCQMDV